MTPRTSTVIGIILIAALSRLVPHPPNFAPITAMALFSAAHFTSRGMAFLVPLAAMLLSDLALGALVWLGTYSGSEWMALTRGLHRDSWILYVTIAAITALGFSLRGRVTVYRTAVMLFAASVLFFLITNFQVWAFWSMYPKTPSGLVTCYVSALPFYRTALAGDVFYAVTLFGGYALITRWFSLPQESTTLTPVAT